MGFFQSQGWLQRGLQEYMFFRVFLNLLTIELSIKSRKEGQNHGLHISLGILPIKNSLTRRVSKPILKGG